MPATVDTMFGHSLLEKRRERNHGLTLERQYLVYRLGAGQGRPNIDDDERLGMLHTPILCDSHSYPSTRRPQLRRQQVIRHC